MMSCDSELVGAYVADGSETAFRALVARHVNLVYATAFRLVGEAGIAEEIAQNVFMVLARKAPRLGGIETLAGWLHRTTVLEAKARIRAELRRKRREETAAARAAIDHEGASPLDVLAPLLDEGLLNLREGDRLALVLRFLEERSLRDVGEALGVNEDTARKRVSRAVERLAEFFRRRGFVVSAGITVLLTGAVRPAPAALATSAGNAGLAAGGAATGFKVFLFQIMSATKTQTALVCTLLAAAPLAWQWNAEARLAREQTDLRAQITSAQDQAAELDRKISEIHGAAAESQRDTANLQAEVDRLNARRSGRTAGSVYRWDDNSPVVRVPKQFVEMLPIAAVSDRRGRLSEQIKEALQLTDAEAEQVQSAIDEFIAGYSTAQAQKVRVVEPTAADLQGHRPEETRVFEVTAIGAQMGELREQLIAAITAAVGSDRSRLLQKALGEWMPMDDEEHGLNSGTAFYNFDHRESFFRPGPGTDSINCHVSRTTDYVGSVSFPIALEEISDLYRPHLQDWIELAKSRPAETETQQ